jgi:hypothetical protein
MQNNQAVFESLFSRNFFDPDNTVFLKDMTAAHPYFSPARFFLLQKTEAGTESFNKEAIKTNILFNNPHWLHFQLLQTDQKNIIADTIIEQVMDEGLPDDTEANGEMEKEIEPMKIELKMTEEKLNLDEAMLFEPMHMVDYFASQGIKLTDEVQMGDKLGKQLKSFTEWLKTMKKVHEENAVELTGQPDTNIVTLAENSNTQAEVLTESMAEVFIKQGKMSKAGEVYKKLSLLNPAKSAYFAAKLENLKES